MQIWRKNSLLDWRLSESDKTFSFMDVAIFDFTLVTVAMVTVGLISVAGSYRQNSKCNCKLLCDISRLTPVKKMRLSIPKTDSRAIEFCETM